jgi:hypothetical protein
MGAFGDCCPELADCLSDEIPEKHFLINEDGELFLTIGHIMTEDGTGWFDSKVFYCPFCGTNIQALAESDRKGMH